MDLENIGGNGGQHSEKQMLYITYTWNLNNKIDECIQQKRNRIADIENKLVVTTGEWEGGRGQDRVCGLTYCKLLCIKYISLKIYIAQHREL